MYCNPLIDFCMKNKRDISVKDVDIKKYSQNKDNTVIYNYNVTLDVNGKHKSTLPIHGQLKLDKIYGKWKVIFIGKLGLENFVNKFY